MQLGSHSSTREADEPAADVRRAAAPRDCALALAGQQLELYRVLAELSQTAADWYCGALMALADSSNPERFAHAAHSLRELMKKLHTFVGVPREGDPADLGSKFVHMAQVWEQARDGSDCHDGDVWNGTIDKQLNRGLVVVDETVAWFRENRPAFRETSMAMFQSVDVSPRQLPPSVAEAHVTRWSQLHRYFNEVAHHSPGASEEEFRANVLAVEQFMLERLRPQASTDYTRLDKLIEEAERGA